MKPDNDVLKGILKQLCNVKNAFSESHAKKSLVPVEFRWICVRPRGLVLAESPGFDGRHMQLPFLYLFIPISIKKSGNKKAAA